MWENSRIMWFSICYVRIVLFVCFVSAQIKDNKLPPPDLKAVVVRQVNCSTDTDIATQVLLDGRWHPLCNDSNFRNIETYFCDLVKKSFTDKAEMFGNAEPTVNSTFVTLLCKKDQPCTLEKQHKCPNGTVRKRCNKERPGAKQEQLKYCSYPGTTATNCSGNDQDLWMTYEHTFYKQDLPNVFTAWTSSYLTKTTSCEEISDASCLNVTSNSSTTTSMLDCFNYCIDPNTSEYNLTLAAVGIHANSCTCYFGGCVQGSQSNRSSSCSEQVYRVTTSSSTNRTQMEYCIAVLRKNYTNTFTVKHWSTLLPQICGTNLCWPQNPCQNGGRCTLANNYLNYTCQCRPDFSGNNCTKSVTQNPNTTEFSNTVTYSKMEPVSQPISGVVVWILAGAAIVVVVLFLICMGVCMYNFRCKEPQKGDHQRPNSMQNRTYGGGNANIMSYEHIDDDDTYDLLDEEGIGSPDNLNKGVLLLDEYSTPNDVVADTTKYGSALAEYTTTYDDPIRKQSEHEDAIALNIGRSTKFTNQGGDIELKHMKHPPEFHETVDKAGSESDSKKSQFKGCLCSMTVSAESDIENTEPVSKANSIDKREPPERQCSNTDRPKLPDRRATEEGHSCSIEDPRTYFTLAPSKTITHVEQTASKVSLTTDNNQDSDYEDTTVENKTGTSDTNKFSFQCHEHKEKEKDKDSDNSDYEDTTVFDNRSRHVTMPDQRDLCLHTPPDVLMEKLGIKIVPASSTYATYMALPKSRADLMNPYYSNFNGVTRPYARDLNDASRDEPRDQDGNQSLQPQAETGDNKEASLSKVDEYDRCYNTRRNLQVQNSNNTYDNLFGLWGKNDARKRLNSY